MAASIPSTTLLNDLKRVDRFLTSTCSRFQSSIPTIFDPRTIRSAYKMCAQCHTILLIDCGEFLGHHDLVALRYDDLQG